MSFRPFYRRYIDTCNAHRFDALGEFVATDVVVNEEPIGLTGYESGLQAIVDEIPDFHWDLRHLLVDGDWLAAHLFDTGTHAPTGCPVSTHEFAVYRLSDGKIAEVWGDLRVLEQLR
jgi:predicted ester cyclase